MLTLFIFIIGVVIIIWILFRGIGSGSSNRNPYNASIPESSHDNSERWSFADNSDSPNSCSDSSSSDCD